MIIKTVREKGITFKLDEPVLELFKQMRIVSSKLLEDLQPHPYYLQVSLNLQICSNFWLISHIKFNVYIFLSIREYFKLINHKP